MRVGDKIIWGDEERPLREGTVTAARVDGGFLYLWVNNLHKPEDCINAAFAWPFEVKEELIAIRAKRAVLKKEYDDSIQLLYDLRNKVTVAARL